MAGTPELARQLGDPGRRPAAAPVPERQVPVAVWQGPGACPLGDPGRRPAADPVPERRRPVPVRLGAGVARPAEVIMAGGLRRPGTRAAGAGGGVAGPRSSPASWRPAAGCWIWSQPN